MGAAIVSIASMKGGVGKTTLTLALAEGTAAYKQKRVLVVDLDPQINASILLTGVLPGNQLPWKTNSTIRHFLDHLLNGRPSDSGRFVVRDVIDFAPAKTVSLLSGDYELRQFERHLLVKSGRSIQSAIAFMNAAVNAIIEEQSCLFDLIVFDCPPGFSILTESALARSDLIILPTAPNNLGTQGLLAFIKYLENDLDLVDSSSRTYAFVTMTRRTTTSNEFERAVRAESRKVNQRYQVLKHTFPYLDAFQKATDRRHQRMRVIGAVQRALSNWRHRTLFERLYQGVDGYVLRVVNEVWDVINQERVDNERVRTRASRRQDRQPETSV